MTKATCRYQDGDCYCQRLKVGCRPGMIGCLLRGKEPIAYDEEGFPSLLLGSGMKRKRRRRKPKGLV